MSTIGRNYNVITANTDVVLRIAVTFGRSKLGSLLEGVHTPEAHRPADKAGGGVNLGD